MKSGKLIILYGNITAEELSKIKKYYINEVEMREKNLDILEENPEQENTEKIPVYENFINKTSEEIEEMGKSLELAMTADDLLFIQEYIKNEEKRNPTETEIRVLDTYWSDHCRHTTFETIIDDVKIENEVGYNRKNSEGICKKQGICAWRKNFCKTDDTDGSGNSIWKGTEKKRRAS